MNPIANSFVIQLQHEIISTRKMLERVPDDKLDWKPHAKSMSLGQLSSHIADLLIFLAAIVDTQNFDFAKHYTQSPVAANAAELVARLDANYALAISKLQETNDDYLKQEWSFSMGEQPIAKMPGMGAIRAFATSHLIHHRGQLSVYLRMLDVSVPSIYGPSADENPFAAAA